jgi:hypothetical protein
MRIPVCSGPMTKAVRGCGPNNGFLAIIIQCSQKE